jgi:hypothetical protein
MSSTVDFANQLAKQQQLMDELVCMPMLTADQPVYASFASKSDFSDNASFAPNPDGRDPNAATSDSANVLNTDVAHAGSSNMVPHYAMPVSWWQKLHALCASKQMHICSSHIISAHAQYQAHLVYHQQCDQVETSIDGVSSPTKAASELVTVTDDSCEVSDIAFSDASSSSASSSSASSPHLSSSSLISSPAIPPLSISPSVLASSPTHLGLVSPSHSFASYASSAPSSSLSDSFSSPPPLPPIVHSGTLRKLSSSSLFATVFGDSWRERFFILTPQYLIYKNSPNDEENAGEIPLLGTRAFSYDHHSFFFFSTANIIFHFLISLNLFISGSAITRVTLRRDKRPLPRFDVQCGAQRTFVLATVVKDGKR